MRAVTISLFAFLLGITTTCIRFCDGNSNVLCIESERQALFKFKQDLIDRSNKLASWVDGEDCCEWIGVSCNNLTGHINELHLGALASRPDEYAPSEWNAYHRSMLRGQINPSLLNLKHLNFLDLSSNDFGGVQIPEFIGSLKSLTYLNLSSANFSGSIPHKLGNLSKLHYLDLGYNFDLEAKTLQWVSSLSSLQYLDLSKAELSNATNWLQVTNKLPSLVELHLSGCNLNNDQSPISVNYTSLAVLELSGNMLTSLPTGMFSLGSLVFINLSFNRVKGMIPNGFQNLSSIKFLDLSGNLFSPSSIPGWLSNLNQLQFLGLGGVGLQGNFSSVIGNMTSLTHLFLSGNQLGTTVPKCLESLCNLRALDLSFNGIDYEVSEIIESLSKCTLDRLETLNVAFNKLSGSLTDQLGQFKKLELLDVSNNMLEGNISEMHFFNLTRLKILSASNNMLMFKPNPSWIPPFHCEIIELGNWHLGPEFPQWLQFQKNLSVVDISHTEISGVIPIWFWSLSTEFLYINFSNNQLTGKLSYLPISWSIDLSSNKFTGPFPQVLPLPQVLPHLGYLFLSKNLFSGSFSSFLCNSSNELEFLLFLDIESNLLSGEIPDCWENVRWLLVLNLGNNHLTGKIPKSMGSLHGIRSLSLHNNSLFGKVPSTLQHLAEMFALDLSENQFMGNIPTWIGDKLSNLVVLNFHSNNFQGSIPHQICALNYLQVLDLGYNNISGVIPKCFSNLSAMATKTRGPSLTYQTMLLNVPFSFYIRTLLVMKGRMYEYSTILRLVTSIDLSANCITGEIFEELGSLIELQSLNLSGNLLTGKIPEKIGNMKCLESLDLSMNLLHGEIPSSFSNLNFLNHLNLSYNNLTGQIPTSTQLQSFDELSYIANHLCGPPISKNCSTNGETSDITKEGDREGRKGSKVNWLYVSIVAGFVMGFWGVMAPIFFIKSWRFAYYRKLEQIGDKLYFFWAIIGM
ncbi:hypothetical protein DITRI_Ditri06bG0145900 [Diplodiscus trichospermus]